MNTIITNTIMSPFSDLKGQNPLKAMQLFELSGLSALIEDLQSYLLFFDLLIE